MKLTHKMWVRIEQHFMRPCELNEWGQIIYQGGNFPVGYIATDFDYAGWLVDVTGDYDSLVCDLKGV